MTEPRRRCYVTIKIHDTFFYNTVFKITHNWYITSGSALPPPNKKFWVRACCRVRQMKMVHKRCRNTRLPQQSPITRQQHFTRHNVCYHRARLITQCPLAGRLLMDIPADASILCDEAAALSDTTKGTLY